MKQLRRLWGAIREKAKKQFYAQILIDVTIRNVRLVKQRICHANKSWGLLPRRQTILLAQEFCNHPHANDTDQSTGSCRGSCEYSLIVLWPHADECDRTAEGERETEVTELALESDCRQKWWEAGGEDILNCLPLSRLVALRCTKGKSKVEVPVYSREDAAHSSACRGFSQIL